MLKQLLKQEKILKKAISQKRRAYEVQVYEVIEKDKRLIEIREREYRLARENLRELLSAKKVFQSAVSTNEDNYKVGDILHTHWGYNCTIIDFYKVVKTTKKMLWLVQLKSKKEYIHSRDAGVIKPSNNFHNFEIFNTKSSNPKIGFQNLMPYEGGEHYFSDPD